MASDHNLKKPAKFLLLKGYLDIWHLNREFPRLFNSEVAWLVATEELPTLTFESPRCRDNIWLQLSAAQREAQSPGRGWRMTQLKCKWACRLLLLNGPWRKINTHIASPWQKSRFQGTQKTQTEILGDGFISNSTEGLTLVVAISKVLKKQMCFPPNPFWIT